MQINEFKINTDIREARMISRNVVRPNNLIDSYKAFNRAYTLANAELNTNNTDQSDKAFNTQMALTYLYMTGYIEGVRAERRKKKQEKNINERWYIPMQINKNIVYGMAEACKISSSLSNADNLNTIEKAYYRAYKLISRENKTYDTYAETLSMLMALYTQGYIEGVRAERRKRRNKKCNKKNAL